MLHPPYGEKCELDSREPAVREYINMEEQAQDGPAPLPDGDDAVPVEAEVALNSPPDRFEAAVLAELEKIRSPKGNWAQALFILAISLASSSDWAGRTTTRWPSPPC